MITENEKEQKNWTLFYGITIAIGMIVTLMSSNILVVKICYFAMAVMCYQLFKQVQEGYKRLYETLDDIHSTISKSRAELELSLEDLEGIRDQAIKDLEELIKKEDKESDG